MPFSRLNLYLMTALKKDPKKAGFEFEDRGESNFTRWRPDSSIQLQGEGTCFAHYLGDSCTFCLRLII